MPKPKPQMHSIVAVPIIDPEVHGSDSTARCTGMQLCLAAPSHSLCFEAHARYS